MAAALAVPGATRSFFFALTSDQREFLFPGDNRERLTLNTLSLGFGARDDVHVLEAEGANADGEKNVKMLVQATAILGVQPSLPAVTLTSTVLALPVTFRLRLGPGPLYVSGSCLAGVEDAAAPVMAAAESLPTASEEPAAKRAGASPEASFAEPLVAQNVTEPLTDPPSWAKYRAHAKYGFHASRSQASVDRKSCTDAALEAMDPEVRKYYDQSKERDLERAKAKIKKRNEANEAKLLALLEPHKNRGRRKDVSWGALENEKAKILKMMAKGGGNLSAVKLKFERFLECNCKVTEPSMMAELWEWRQTLK